jgi:hypothetical protein
LCHFASTPFLVVTLTRLARRRKRQSGLASSLLSQVLVQVLGHRLGLLFNHRLAMNNFFLFTINRGNGARSNFFWSSFVHATPVVSTSTVLGNFLTTASSAVAVELALSRACRSTFSGSSGLVTTVTFVTLRRGLAGLHDFWRRLLLLILLGRGRFSPAISDWGSRSFLAFPGGRSLGCCLARG